MAEGFTYAKAQSILTSNIRESTYVGLSSTTPDKNGANFNELSKANGYKRAAFGKLNLSKASQVANDEIIFFFVALGDCGSASHLGLFDSEQATVPFMVAKLQPTLTIGENYVPLIREHKLVIGLDVDVLDTNYSSN